MQNISHLLPEIALASFGFLILIADMFVRSEDADDENALSMGWRARDVVQPGRNFQFSHGVHLNLLDARITEIGQSGQGCRVCHILDFKADFAASYGDFDIKSYTSNFKAIDKDTCSDCHAKGNVREGCQLCHDYHREQIFRIRISIYE